MLQITKKVDYALIALTHLTIHEGERFSARELAESYQLSKTLMANSLKPLARGDLIRSVRGTKGGYELAVAASEITVGDVFELLEGPLQLATCIGQHPGDMLQCNVSRVCPVKHSVFKIHQRIRDVLYQTTVAELARDTRLPGAVLPIVRSQAAPSEPELCNSGRST